MKSTTTIIPFAGLLAFMMISPFDPSSQQAYAYPPGVGILSKSKNCLSCHANNGPWTDGGKTIIDIIAPDSRKSFRQPDGSFLLPAKRHQSLTVLTIIGYDAEAALAPYRNGWIYIDPTTIESSSISKFAPGWDVNLQASCRLVGDTLHEYKGFRITALPMTIRPLDSARDANLVLQGMLTRGESVKGKAREGMAGNYFERSVTLKVID